MSGPAFTVPIKIGTDASLNIHTYGEVGPWNLNGSYYALLRQGTTALSAVMYKASDPVNGPWAAVGTSSAPTISPNASAYFAGFAFADSNGLIHYVVLDQNTGQVRYNRFDTSTDTWTIVDEVAGTGEITTGINQFPSLAVRSDGSVVIAYTTGISQGNQPVKYRIRSPAGAWSAATTIATNGNRTVVAVLGAGDRVHFLWGAASTIAHESLSFAGVLDTGATLSLTASPPLGAFAYTDDAGTHVRVGFVTSSQESTQGQVLLFDSAANPTLSSRAVTSSGASEFAMGGDFLGQEMIVLWQTASGLPAFNTSAAQGSSGWSGDQIASVPTPTSGRLAGHVYLNHAGVWVLGVLYSTSDSGGQVYYTELTLTSQPTAPINVVRPAVSGTVQAGQTVSAQVGTWQGSPTGYSYQWRQNGTNIVGATSSTYVVQSGDRGHLLDVVVTATNAASSTSAVSKEYSVPRTIFQVVTGTDSAAAADVGTRGGRSSTRAGSDTALAAETTRTSVSRLRSGVDTSTSADVGTAQNVTPVSGSDTAAAADAAHRGPESAHRAGADAAGAVDVPVRRVNIPRTATDTSVSLDAASRVAIWPRSGSDTADSSETTTAQALIRPAGIASTLAVGTPTIVGGTVQTGPVPRRGILIELTHFFDEVQNLMPDPRFESGARRVWASDQVSNAETGVTSALAIEGDYSLQVAAGDQVTLLELPWSPGEPLSISVDVAYATADAAVGIVFSNPNLLTPTLSANQSTVTGAQPQTVGLSSLAPPLTTKALVYVRCDDAGTACFDRVCITPSADPQPFFDGDTGGAEWDSQGTYSTSSRNGEPADLEFMTEQVGPYWSSDSALVPTG